MKQGILIYMTFPTDIGESNDLSSSLPDITRDLCIKLRDHLKTVNGTMPTLDPTKLYSLEQVLMLMLMAWMTPGNLENYFLILTVQ